MITSGRASSSSWRARSKPARRWARGVSGKRSQFFADAIKGTCEHAIPATICAISMFSFAIAGIHRGTVSAHRLAGRTMSQQQQQGIDAAIIELANFPALEQVAFLGVERVGVKD